MKQTPAVQEEAVHLLATANLQVMPGKLLDIELP